MTTIRFADFPAAEKEKAISACQKAGVAMDEFEFLIEETFERGDGGHLRRVVSIARKKPKVNRTYDASSACDWPLVFEAALLNGEFK